MLFFQIISGMVFTYLAEVKSYRKISGKIACLTLGKVFCHTSINKHSSPNTILQNNDFFCSENGLRIGLHKHLEAF